PPGQPPVARQAESLRDIFGGLWAVWRTPGLGKVLAVHTFAYASQSTVLGLWAGPYLHDIHGLGAVGRGNVLLAMGAAQICGLLIFGPLDRLFNTRKWVIIAGGVLSVSILAALAALHQPPVWLAIGLMVGLCLVTTYSLVIVAHGRSLFPDHLAGRGITTVNIAQVIGCAFLPIATGIIVNAFPSSASGYDELGYRYAFGFIGLSLAAGLAIYATATDSKPKPAT
ncbi:MAG: MFS transporter, partial [Alphaproteobacteria bacterium]|nr:MFS transporter [Alphaproteobacteria bacterium]